MAGLVQDFLRESAMKHPGKAALVCGGKSYSYQTLEKMANRLAHGFRAEGLERGDRLGIYLGNTVDAVVSIFGALKAGAVVVPVNRAIKSEKLRFILGHCEAAALVTDARAFNQLGADQLQKDLPSLRRVIVTGHASSNGVLAFSDFVNREDPALQKAPPTQAIDLDLACLIYTSGTTGEPKGVMCDHSNVMFVTRAITQYLENSETDVILNVLPLAFSYGLYQLMATFATGATLVLEDSFAFPTAVVQKMAEHRVTGFAGVPTIYSILLGMDLSQYDLSALRYVTNAAAGLPVEHVKRLRQRLPRVRLYLMHGLTEVARTMYLPPDQTEHRPASSGIAMPGTELWVANEQGERLPAGEVGELVVRGRHVMRGYWNDPAASAKRFRPGPIPGERLCYSGDLFRIDEEGFFYFVSRKDDIIKSRGEKIAPREVENVLYAIPGVQDAAVIGVPDPLWGQVVKAFVVAPGGDLTESVVIAHCKARLEDVMVPRLVEFRAELPKTPSGKIKKLELR
jgi:amino acid adenylation domain-containing protein